jgi:hypothetical protein
MTMANEWGPLWGLVGEWEGTGGLDTAFSHALGRVIGTPFRERSTFEPFGPVDNGQQHLYGLDYRGAMWKEGQENPFHTEIGYLLWDGATGEVMRCFAVPRGISVLAGGTAEADATTITMHAAMGETPYAIGENRYLAAQASTVSYSTTITIGDGTWSYDETTMLRMSGSDELLAHTDHNTLVRVA